MKKKFCLLFTLIVVLCMALALTATVAWADSQNTIEDIYISNSNSITYTGKEVRPVVKAYHKVYGYNYLVEGRDYTVEYSNNINVGTATVKVTGTTNYTGNVTGTFEIKPCSISKVNFTMSTTYYSEGPQAVKVSGEYNGIALKENVDYTITSIQNGRINIEGKGNFTGTTYTYFSVKAKPLDMCTVKVSDVEYTGSAVKPSVTVYNDGYVVPSSKYNVSYSNNVEVGIATVKVTSANSSYYTGSTTASFRIKYGISKCSVTVDSPTYTGSPVKPAVTIKKGNTVLKENVDYSLSFSNNTNAGTGTVKITGMGSYTGTATKSFTINPKSVSTAVVTLVLPEEKYVYSGEAFTPDATAADGTVALVKDKDYTISYSKNINPGYGQVIVKGIGNYGSSKTEKFEILPSEAKISGFEVADNNGIKIKWAKGPSTCKYKVYRSGKLIGTTKKGATYYIDKKSKTNGKKYEYTIQAVAADSDDLKGEMSNVKYTYYIKAPVAKVSVSGNRALTVSWKKISNAGGYQVQWSTSSKFKTKKTSTIKDNATLRKFLSGLTVGKKYYFRVRAYRTITEEVPVEVKENTEAGSATADQTEISTEVKTEKKTKKYYSSWSKTVSGKPITATAHSSAS